MREKLKNYLNYEYDKAEVIKLFANKTAHHIIDSKLRNMFDL